MDIYSDVSKMKMNLFKWIYLNVGKEVMRDYGKVNFILHWEKEIILEKDRGEFII